MLSQEFKEFSSNCSKKRKTENFSLNNLIKYFKKFLKNRYIPEEFKELQRN